MRVKGLEPPSRKALDPKSSVSTNFTTPAVKFNWGKYNQVFIAYEPLWSIGSGLVPSNKEILEVIEYIKFFLKDYSFKKLKILYGGSVNSENLEQLSKIKELDGFLVGSASIKKSFINKFKL